jgi:hypothetical protein
VLAWVKDRGELYLLRPLLLAGISVLAVGSFYLYPCSSSFVHFDCDSIFLPSSLACFLAGF